jgi:outer membrane lipoprotein SlyB
MKSLRQAFAAAVAIVFFCLAASPPPVLAQARRIAGAVASATQPRVDGFDVEQVAQLAPGTPLNFALYGAAGATATLRIDGAAHTLALKEVEAGVYEGTYVLGRDDRIEPESRVTANLWLAGQSTTVVLEEPLVLGAAQPRGCADCAVVEAVRPVDEQGQPGVVGAMAGGLVGAIVGSQFGRGDGRKTAGILGAVGGAYVGREIERQQGTRTRYEVVVRSPDGATQTRRYDAPPPFRVGDRVRIADGTWRPEPPPVMP